MERALGEDDADTGVMTGLGVRRCASGTVEGVVMDVTGDGGTRAAGRRRKENWAGEKKGRK